MTPDSEFFSKGLRTLREIQEEQKMSMGTTAVIGRAETIEHVLADRRRLKAALADTTTTPEKRAEVEARLVEVETTLTQIKAAIDGPSEPV